MARISGVTIPQEKIIEIALAYVYGVGPTRSKYILAKAGIDGHKRTHALDSAEVKKIQDVIDAEFTVGDELRREILLNVKRLKEINSYRGSRHAKGLPVRGQRTKTNSRTVRGNVRMTAGSGRKKSSEKT